MVVKTYDPIVQEEAYTASFFPQIPYVGAKEAVILYGADGNRKLVIREGVRVKTADLRKGKYNQKVKVDLHSHMIVFRDFYASSNGFAKFEIEVRASASVAEPDQVFEQGVRDVAEAVEEELRGKLQDLALAYELDDAAHLREKVRLELGDFYQLDAGITVNNINVQVRMDPKYEQLRERTEYEKRKAKAADELKEVYQESVTAIFAQVAEGSITAADAYAMARKRKSEDFDEYIRQLRAAASFVNEMKEQDLIRTSDVYDQMNQMICNLLLESGSGAGAGIPEKKKDGGERDLYAPFDE